MCASKTVYAMLEECSRSMAGTFSRQEILTWFGRHYPDARESTISAHIQATTSNATNRGQHHPFLAARQGRSQGSSLGSQRLLEVHTTDGPIVVRLDTEVELPSINSEIVLVFSPNDVVFFPSQVDPTEMRNP